MDKNLLEIIPTTHGFRIELSKNEFEYEGNIERALEGFRTEVEFAIGNTLRNALQDRKVLLEHKQKVLELRENKKVEPKVKPRFGMAIKYNNKEEFDKILEMYKQLVSNEEELSFLSSTEFNRLNVEQNFNYFEIDNDGMVWPTLLLNQLEEGTKIYNLEEIL